MVGEAETGDASRLERAYSWVAGTVLGDAACLTLVQSADRHSVALGFGGDPGRARRLPLAAASAVIHASGSRPVDELAEEPWVAVRTVGSWVLAVEVNGWQGSRPEVLERISSGTRAVSVYWNVNGQTRFSYAAGGRVLTAFEALFPDRRTGEDPDGLESVRVGLPWDEALPTPLALALAARLTGSPAEPSWLDGTFEVFPVEPHAQALQPAVDPDLEPLTYDDPPLAWALRHATADQQREAAMAAARYAVGVAGLQDHPDVALALRGNAAAAADGLARLSAALDRSARKSGGDPGPAGRFWAVTSLREAANPLPLAAGFAASHAAANCVSAFWAPYDGVRGAVLAELGDPRPPSGSLGLTAVPGPLPTDKYLWTAAHWLAPVACITFVKGLSPADVIEKFGGDPRQATSGLPGLFPDRIAAIREQSGWVVVVEHHELMGLFSRYENVMPGTAVSISWSARQRPSWLQYVVDGRFVAMLDPQCLDRRDGDDPSVLDEHLTGLRLGDDAPVAASCLPTLLVLAERLTGLAFTPQLLGEPHLLAFLPVRPGDALPLGST